jgi:hypothetical protein
VRLAPVAAACLVAAPGHAHADREPVVVAGITIDARAIAADFSAAGTAETRILLGGRMTVSFEDAPMPVPPPGDIAADLRLAPELLAGFVANDVHAEGYLGAGLRGELWLASARRGFRMRTAMYTAARAIVIGGHQDGAAELALGEYLLFTSGKRFGWEGSALIRPRGDSAASQARELDAQLSIYLGW